MAEHHRECLIVHNIRRSRNCPQLLYVISRWLVHSFLFSLHLTGNLSSRYFVYCFNSFVISTPWVLDEILTGPYRRLEKNIFLHRITLTFAVCTAKLYIKLMSESVTYTVTFAYYTVKTQCNT